MKCSAWVLLVPLLAACTSSPPSAPDPGPRFDDQGQQDVTCMIHQPRPPGPRYTDPAVRRTDETLPLLRYYTAHARKPYCDNNGPTENDKSWARLYVEFGADRANVVPLLG